MSAPENNSDQASVPTMVPAQAVIARPSYEEIPRTSNQSTMLGIERYFTFLRRRWWLLLVSLTICVGLAAAYIRWWPVSYVSTARMWVAGKTKLREGAVYDEQTQNYAGTQAELLQSTKIQQLAVTRVKEVRHITIPTDPEGRPLLIKLRVTPVQRSAILELKAQGPAEEYVRAFLDATMEVFLVYKGELRSTSVGDTYSSVSQQLKRQEIELKAEQEKLAAYQRENNVAVLEEQAKAAGIYLSKLLTELSELKLEYQLLNAGVPQNQGDSPPLPTQSPVTRNRTGSRHLAQRLEARWKGAWVLNRSLNALKSPVRD